jgi:hypothetical protein
MGEIEHGARDQANADRPAAVASSPITM